MKKRFLSAALALAMVLTLLPVTAFADITKTESSKDDPGNGQTVTVSKGMVTWKYTDPTDKKSYTSDAVALEDMDGGVIGGGNTWYTSMDDAIEAGKTSIILCDDNLEIPANAVKLSSLTIDLNGHAMKASTVTVDGTDTGHRLGSLTVRDSAYEDGAVTDSKITVAVTGKSFKVDAANAKLADITINGEKGAGTVTLDNAEAGVVTLGTLGVDKSKKTVSSTQKLTLTGGSTVGATTIEGNGSTVSVTDSTIGTSLKITGTAASGNGNLYVAGWKSSVAAVTLCGSTNKDVTSGTGPKVTIVGGTVTSIEADTTNEKLSAPNYNISVTGGEVKTGITLTNATVKVDGATSGKITQETGSLTISGGASVSDGVEWGSAASAGSINLTIEGDKTTTGNIEMVSKSQVTMGTVKISGGTTGTIDLGGYAGRGITGGTFGESLLYTATSKKNLYLAKDMQYELSDGKTYWTYISGTNVNDVFQAVVDKYVDGKTTVRPVDTDNGAGTTVVTFQFTNETGAEAVVKITAAKTDRLRLPTTVSGRPVAVWYNGTTKKPEDTYTGSYVVGDSNVTLVASVTTRDEFITDVSVDDSSTVKGISAVLSGDTIKLTNAVELSGSGRATIVLNVKTGSNSKGYKVSVTYFDSDGGITIDSVDGVFTYRENKLILNGQTYIIDGSGLKGMTASVVSEGIKSDDKADVKANTSRVTGSVMTSQDKKDLKDALEKGTTVDFSGSPAVLEAVTRQMGSISPSTASSYIAAAKKDMATKYKNAKGTKDDKIDDAYIARYGGGFDTVTVRAYLYIDVTNYKPFGSDAVGSMTANLTPYYEIVVTGGKDWDGEAAEYVAKSGTSLGTLSGDLGKVEIKIAVPDNFASDGAAIWVHHGDYVYENSGGNVTWIDKYPASGSADGDGDSGSSDPAPASKDTIDIAFTTLDGFSPFTFNGTEPAVAVQNADPAETLYFDSLQTAIDEVKDKGLVTVGPDYSGTKALTVTGPARTFYVDCGSNKALRLTFAGADANQSDTYDNYYTVTLEKDIAPVGGNITIASATGGSARVSANPAKQGETVTVTLTPSTGYASSGVAVRTSTGAAVSVSGSGNSYTFVMPAGSVTVTPSFRVSTTDNKATINVSPSSIGSASVYTGTTDGKVEQGGTAIVTVKPSSGYRTMDVILRADNGRTVGSSRQSQDVWNITVPSGATSVTVTPSFDRDNGTPFTDVLYSHWASDDISWVYSKKYSTGYGSQYEYKPSYVCTKWELVTFLWKSQGYIDVTGWYANPFKDVSANYPNNQAYQAILWAASQGIIDTSSGYFQPTASISRADTVLILYNHAKRPTVSGTSGFADVASNAYYAKAVTWARQKGLTNGYNGNTYFRPDYTITRAEIAAFLHRAFG